LDLQLYVVPSDAADAESFARWTGKRPGVGVGPDTRHMLSASYEPGTDRY